MDKAAYRDEIKFQLTGGVLELELDDASIDKVIDIGLREIQRYYCVPNIMTIPYKKCIELSEYAKVNTVTAVFRTEGYLATNKDGSYIDPMQASQWQLLSGTGNLYNFQEYAYRYAAWNTLLQIRNTTSTDLAYRYDKNTERLYVNILSDTPEKITIEYIPRLDNVDEIKSDYWIDMLMRMCVALTKVTLGRIRTRYVQSSALWTQDGQTMLDEGTAELSSLRETLSSNTQLMYPID